MQRRSLLAGGILAPLLYASADLIAGLRTNGYSFRDQTISELGAIGAPSRPLFGTLVAISYVMLLGFGVGVRRSAVGNRRLRSAGGLLIAFATLALTVGSWAAMRPRGTEQGLAGALHLIEGGVAMLLVFATMGFAAAGLGRGFRAVTLATLVLVLAFGAWTAVGAPGMEAGLPTPWLGARERVFWYAYHSWFALLAIALLRREAAEPS